jgi:glucose-6-phosphate isomerase
MPLKSTNPTKTKSWSKLEELYSKHKDFNLKEDFKNNSNRASDFSIKWEDFYVDFSKNLITKDIFNTLLDLANEVDLKDAIEKYFSGDIINQTENRAVLHTALRSYRDEVFVNNENVIPDIEDTKVKMNLFVNDILCGVRKGYTEREFDTVVNIGIGGSDLGPAMVVDSLKYYKNHLTTYFVSNIDGDHVNEVVKNLNPETTLFVVVSKTFTTQETISNATTLKNWFLNFLPESAVAKHFVAVSTNHDKVKEFGISLENVFPMKDWVGGRFSLWSSVGLSIALSVGFENFESLLLGAQKMDSHFRNTEFENNLPVILALQSVWYNNFYEVESEVVLPYSQYLNQFATYLQQGIMESNGKGVDRSGQDVDYQTGTIVWGEPGSNSQHAFFQLIHQGTKLIPAEFIGFVNSLHGNEEHHNKLMSNFFAQTEALMKGKTKEEVKADLVKRGLSDSEIEKTLPFKVFKGNKPTTTVLIDTLTPESLGKLIALYEHRIFVQGVIWNIFSYDQFGVELGKELANNILEEFDTKDIKGSHDSSTKNLLMHFVEAARVVCL